MRRGAQWRGSLRRAEDTSPENYAIVTNILSNFHTSSVRAWQTARRVPSLIKGDIGL